ncbi:SRPBCC family protein [Aliiroseovarius sp. PTFE2010]|uniref:SRPBCC family protein n=1 Tax=Aliiroseovarius sp. PTFE2010 TaxID=3417190 RepID=UPI003CF0D734
MKLSTREDIEAPIEHVYREIADFDAIEKQVLRRGVVLERTDAGGPGGLGRAWKATFEHRGKTRKADARIADVGQPNGYVVFGTIGGVEAEFQIDLVALSRNRTRVVAGVEMRPKTLSARLLIQSLKLGKAGLQRRFARRMKNAAKIIGDRHTIA